MATTPSQADRNASELWQRSRNAVGLKIEFEIASWPVLLKKSCAGTLVMWGYSWSAPARPTAASSRELPTAPLPAKPTPHDSCCAGLRPPIQALARPARRPLT